MSVKFGFRCRLFRNTATWASPVWSALNVVRETTLGLTDEEWDASTRAALGWDQTEPTTRKATIEGSCIWTPADTGLIALRDAYLNRTALDLAALDGAASGEGSQGLRAMWKVFQFVRPEELRAGCIINFSLKPCYEITNLPNWMTAA